MKNLLFLLLLVIGSDLFGQTDSIEKATLYNAFKISGVKESEMTKILIEWNQKISRKYPDLPLDQNKQVHYIFLNEFKDLDKEKLFNRTLEWMAINYGIVPADIYSNVNDGKIIFRNNLDLTSDASCAFTSVISIKNEKIKVEILSISYQTYYQGYPKSYKISELIPMILKKSSDWNFNLELLTNTDKLFKDEIKNLSDYIQSYYSSDTF
jgi:hypothetical protein